MAAMMFSINFVAAISNLAAAYYSEGRVSRIGFGVSAVLFGIATGLHLSNLIGGL